ncbi:hypothetical protein MUTS15_05210 [Escherichia coli]|nr:hypothetical protein MUTS15_05210 [Escherichia coli]
MFKANHWQLEKEGSHVKQHSYRRRSVGYQEVPADAYYGVHTLRAIENFYISNNKISDIPEFVRGMVMVKKPQLWQTKSCKPFLKV